MEQMEVLVSCFLRPFKMAASSKKPPCSHEDVNSIFLNSETVLFLHQIFLKGLTSRMESWPTLVLGEYYKVPFDRSWQPNTHLPPGHGSSAWDAEPSTSATTCCSAANTAQGLELFVSPGLLASSCMQHPAELEG